MKRSHWFVIGLQILCWVSATSRSFPPNDGVVGVHQAGTDHNAAVSSQAALLPELNEVAKYRGMSKIGSSPPSCDKKCYGCTPCEAIQVPSTTKKHTHFGIQYANYEPEGWKCKCGPTFYSP